MTPSRSQQPSAAQHAEPLSLDSAQRRRSAAHPYRVRSVAFLKAYAITARPYLFFVSGSSGLLGLAMTHTLTPGCFWTVFAVLFSSYGMGQALTDVFQTDTDAISAPYRPLVRGEISKRQVLAVSLVGLTLCAVVLAVCNPWTLLVSGLGVAGLASYTPLKRRVWGGPPWNSLICALIPALGYLCDGQPLWAAFSEPALLLAMASVYFSYAVFVLLGYLKDVEADRATGYDTWPVHFGRKATVALSALHWLAALGFSLALLVRGGQISVVGAGLWLWGSALLGAAHVRVLPTTRDEQAHPALAWVVSGYVAMHLGEVVLLRPGLTAVCLLLVPLSYLALRSRPERSQL